MKKPIILCLMTMTLVGCTTMQTYNKQAQSFTSELQKEGDPIQVIQAYKNDYICPTRTDEAKALEMVAWVYLFPFKLAYEITDAFMDFGTERQYQCVKRDLLMEPGIKLECTDKTYSDEFANNTDECVLFRRSPEFHKSQVGYFDYKRFLGENSVIKTDEDFLKLVERYDAIAECEQLSESTTVEKTACKEKRKNEIRALSMRAVPCSELISEKYTEYLKKQGEWFFWAIDHDPNAAVRFLNFVGEYQAARWAYAPVYTRSEARKRIKEDITAFGQKNFCTTTDWQQEMKKLGFNL